jgi:hypothetical protein
MNLLLHAEVRRGQRCFHTCSRPSSTAKIPSRILAWHSSRIRPCCAPRSLALENQAEAPIGSPWPFSNTPNLKRVNSSFTGATGSCIRASNGGCKQAGVATHSTIADPSLPESQRLRRISILRSTNPTACFAPPVWQCAAANLCNKASLPAAVPACSISSSILLSHASNPVQSRACAAAITRPITILQSRASPLASAASLPPSSAMKAEEGRRSPARPAVASTRRFTFGKVITY